MSASGGAHDAGPSVAFAWVGLLEPHYGIIGAVGQWALSPQYRKGPVLAHLLGKALSLDDGKIVRGTDVPSAEIAVSIRVTTSPDCPLLLGEQGLSSDCCTCQSKSCDGFTGDPMETRTV